MGEREESHRLIEEIEREVRFARELIGKESLDPRVLHAMAEVPRDRFVPDALVASAFADTPLPIGYGQTISQPFIVALMTDLLSPGAEDRVLEVGTGSGYQAAILSRLVQRVCSIEVVPELADEARARLYGLGYTNIEIRSGDGYDGWVEEAPFDAIIVTAATPHLPLPLLEQLRIGGRIVLPLGQPGVGQELTLVEKRADGRADYRAIMPVAFVPLIRGPARA